ncbi:hypothetical protein CKAH01_12267 [Colletotrichum kahawae]|uniref:Azaphilone pigments biosynthesis cluster protein L N-terminal domain-containing protein n=1 Tax=Colletotrichum kahawae TaxID=34407 RepID=A0AAD9YRS2_COLKA|nr:hypothetical protein CKAH01_12267 [Colletotrichum kahawae]
MSGVEAGATIVGLVGFGLTSLKAFYQFISSVKDGPEKVRDLANDLRSLQAAYERIQALGDLPGIFASSPSLPDLLKDCNESIGKLQKKIGKLQVRPNDKFHGVVWKRLKMAFNDDDIAQALGVLSGYVGKFTLEIGVIELRLVHQNGRHMSQLVAGGERHLTMAKQQHSMLEKIGTDMNSFIPQIQQFENSMNTVAVKITSMQSLSPGQATEIIARLEKLESGFDSMSLQNKTPANKIAVDGNSWPVPQEETENPAILASIQNLCALVDRQERHIESDEAQDVIEDGDNTFQDRIASVLFKPRGSHSHYVIKATVRQFQRMHGFYSFAPTVTVSRIRPRSSRVFQCVRFGDMTGLLQLLASGEASLQDRDDKGASLLHVSAAPIF